MSAAAAHYPQMSANGKKKLTLQDKLNAVKTLKVKGAVLKKHGKSAGPKRELTWAQIGLIDRCGLPDSAEFLFKMHTKVGLPHQLPGQ